MSSTVSTRFLIISDTHDDQLNNPLRRSADVAIHCGDLTEESKLGEFKGSIRLLKQIDAPLKLVIAGNDDFTLDTPVFEKKLKQIDIDAKLIDKEYGAIGKARAFLESEDAKAAGIVFLDEGIHHFRLTSGANLTIYASPYTPSLSDSGWGHQYHPQQGRDWAIDSSVDVAITHYPPRGVLDYTDSKQRAGSPELFAAIARAKPQIHCFGHIHEGWGAKKVTWRSEISETPSHFTDIDNDESTVVESLSGLRVKKFDDQDVVDEKTARKAAYDQKGCVEATDLALQRGKQTLFVNAAIEGLEEGQQQWPWMVDIELPRAKDDVGQDEARCEEDVEQSDAREGDNVSEKEAKCCMAGSVEGMEQSEAREGDASSGKEAIGGTKRRVEEVDERPWKRHRNRVLSGSCNDRIKICS